MVQNTLTISNRDVFLVFMDHLEATSTNSVCTSTTCRKIRMARLTKMIRVIKMSAIVTVEARIAAAVAQARMEANAHANEPVVSL